VENKSLFDQF